MRELPILMNGPMVRAVLEGRKTVTRRVVKPAPPVGHSFFGFCTASTCRKDEGGAVWSAGEQGVRLIDPLRVHCPYGQPGDRLWVRETFKPIASGEVKDGYGEVRYGYAYQADSSRQWNARPTIIHDLTGQPSKGPMQFQQRPWRSPATMPHRASRITLEVTGVRVERLQDISEEDALAEGIDADMCRASIGKAPLKAGYLPVCAFSYLWEQINGVGSWDANPWVWAISFRRIDGERRNG
ncbi:hypothetical protein [Dyella sp.]|uniref:hypothetical protein n=1 Tax=Dyella sp. TaxID=1869338 RepID=UPI00283BF6AA|nr:hypothetical protein [Dyella sp.]MDR3445942.1 hypothetical protein [Dyella sp.]